MPLEQKNTQGEQSFGERLRHSMVLLICLDLITLGLYSAARSYLVHAEISQKTGRRPFSPAFLHILIVLNLLLWILRFSRENMPMDVAVIMTRLGTGLLLITLLLIFRRYLRSEFQLRIRPLPLAVFGFWYLQYRINRHRRTSSMRPTDESWLVAAMVVAVSLTLSLAVSTLRQFRISNSAMEPTLVVGDHVLVDPLSYRLERQPQRGDLLVFTSLPDRHTVLVKRVLGLPGDRLAFHGDVILLNDNPLHCSWIRKGKPGWDVTDQNVKRFFLCEVDGRRFTLQHYEEGALTAIEGDFEVPPGHYFMVGDNLDNSPDSRTTGPIPAQNVLGRARMTTISYRPGEPIPWHRWFQLL